MDKHISSTQKIYTYVIILLICIISITAAIMRCADLIKNNYLDQAKRNLADISIHNSEYLKDQIEMRYELLESIAKTLDLEQDKRKELIYLFKPVVESFNLKRIGFCDENGIAYATEADPVNGKISNESPIGQALLGQKKNKVVEVQAPVGVIKLKIFQVGIKTKI